MSIKIGVNDKDKIAGEFKKLAHMSDPTLYRWIFVPNSDPNVTKEEYMEACETWASVFGLDLDCDAWLKRRNPEQLKDSDEAEIVLQDMKNKGGSYEESYQILDALIELTT